MLGVTLRAANTHIGSASSAAAVVPMAAIAIVSAVRCKRIGSSSVAGGHAFVAHPARRDGDFARMFGLVGTTAIGKTRLSEYGFSASAEFVDEPPVRNPWHTGHTSGASSAGSAAFVAAGAVPMAHANDGGGSIRIPAACNGLVGLKPTRGRVPSDRVHREMPVRIVHDGVVTRWRRTGVTAETSVAEAAASGPAAAAVLGRHGFDLCCGGPKTLTFAAQAHGVDLQTLLAELHEAAG